MDQQEADARARAGVEAIFERYMKLAEGKADELYDYDAMTRVTLLSVSAAERKCVFKFVPTQRYANLNNVVHGGAYAVLFDMFTMASLGTISRKNYWDFMGGVTRSLSLSYLRPLPPGAPMYFHCHVVQHGRTMAMMRAEVKDEAGRVCATAEHHKVHVPSLREHMSVGVGFDGVVEGEWLEDEKERARREEGRKGKL